MITLYQSTKGPMEIATMPGRYLGNAHAKLVRERLDDSRDDEIEAMAARLAEIAAEAEAAAAAEEGK